jgi:hypothetical protein
MEKYIRDLLGVLGYLEASNFHLRKALKQEPNKYRSFLRRQEFRSVKQPILRYLSRSRLSPRDDFE